MSDSFFQDLTDFGHKNGLGLIKQNFNVQQTFKATYSQSSISLMIPRNLYVTSQEFLSRMKKCKQPFLLQVRRKGCLSFYSHVLVPMHQLNSSFQVFIGSLHHARVNATINKKRTYQSSEKRHGLCSRRAHKRHIYSPQAHANGRREATENQKSNSLYVYMNMNPKMSI